MPDANKERYYRGREQRERRLAATATDPAVAAAHREMAERYHHLIGAADRPGCPAA